MTQRRRLFGATRRSIREVYSVVSALLHLIAYIFSQWRVRDSLACQEKEENARVRYLTQTWAESEGGWHFPAGCAPITVDTTRMAFSVMGVRPGCIVTAWIWRMGRMLCIASRTTTSFFCRHCIIAASGAIDYAAMMSRIASRAPDVRAMLEQAESKQQLLWFYRDTLPDACLPTRDSVSVDQPQVCVAAAAVHLSVCSRRR